MAEEQDQERTEQATQKRREDFRKKGQVAQSKEVHTALLLTSALLLWYFYLPFFWPRLQFLVADIWRRAGEIDVTGDSVYDLALALLQQVGMLLAPLLLMVLVVGALGSIMQIGFLLTTKPLEPDLSKLNPIQGAKKFFSKRSAVEVVKSLAKVGLVGFVAFKTVHASFAESVLLVDAPLGETVRFLGRIAGLVLFKSCGVLVVLALFDYLFVRWEMEQRMKMTKQEIKEEFKETEGDPHLKARVRSIQQEMARKRMMAEVPKADVVVTNPTHLSVALKYDRETMLAPQVVAKGADHLAMKIREIAREHKVVMVENVPVARALYQLEVGQTIPEEMFTAVAEILAYVYSVKKKSF
ncbi:flagellar biosynthetic protein FlhB [Geothermobacter ehrlichii]|uniref:Flagellar biosynthetic protein FlhB n=1 Tax=Geothermobacter ehrlichii TaxID=213224 RepID=A0A5D3WPC1_9BACT|nr:flagellar biosynthesis protein FlhB [Geothermobacter ehrlichii]TYP00194.1 flagellar biosynthetic protein FlhB [Geothermobacter ehrlichii]